MLSYVGEIRDGWQGSYDEESYRHYQYLSKVELSLSRTGLFGPMYLTFYVSDKLKGDSLKNFIEGVASRVEIDGSEGSIKIQRSTNQQQFVFTVCYQGPYVKLEFALDSNACHEAFSSLLSDLKKYPSL